MFYVHLLNYIAKKKNHAAHVDFFFAENDIIKCAVDDMTSQFFISIMLVKKKTYLT